MDPKFLGLYLLFPLPIIQNETLFTKLFKIFFLFFFSRLHLQHMEVPRQGIKSDSAAATGLHQSQQCHIRATSVTYATACSNTGSLTHGGQGWNPHPHGYYSWVLTLLRYIRNSTFQALKKVTCFCNSGLPEVDKFRTPTNYTLGLLPYKKGAICAGMALSSIQRRPSSFGCFSLLWSPPFLPTKHEETPTVLDSAPPHSPPTRKKKELEDNKGIKYTF